MANNGSLLLNSVSDAELVKILEVKMRHESSMNFNPQQMQLVAVAQQPGKPPHPGRMAYNNVVLAWADESGLGAVQEIVHFLLKKEEGAKAVGQ